jgi:adenine-specific DNA methylase
MVEIYSNLAKYMPENGMQLVMFTHQNPAVWADLGMILWAAGLKVTAAWTVST